MWQWCDSGAWRSVQRARRCSRVRDSAPADVQQCWRQPGCRGHVLLASGRSGRVRPCGQPHGRGVRPLGWWRWSGGPLTNRQPRPHPHPQCRSVSRGKRVTGSREQDGFRKVLVVTKRLILDKVCPGLRNDRSWRWTHLPPWLLYSHWDSTGKAGKKHKDGLVGRLGLVGLWRCAWPRGLRGQGIRVTEVQGAEAGCALGTGTWGITPDLRCGVRSGLGA